VGTISTLSFRFIGLQGTVHFFIKRPRQSSVRGLLYCFVIDQNFTLQTGCKVTAYAPHHQITRVATVSAVLCRQAIPTERFTLKTRLWQHCAADSERSPPENAMPACGAFASKTCRHGCTARKGGWGCATFGEVHLPPQAQFAHCRIQIYCRRNVQRSIIAVFRARGRY